MPAPTSDDLRRVVIQLLSLGFDIPMIMAITELAESTIHVIRRRWEESGSSRRPETYGIMGRPRLLEMQDVWYLAERLMQCPDLFLDELQQELEALTGVEASIPTIQRTLERFGFTYKVLDKRAMERCDEDRDKFRRLIQAFRIAQLVFADESSINRRGTYRSRGYAILGDRAVKKTFFARGKRFSILPALTVQGILTALIVPKSFDAALFLEFIKLCLASMNPFPQDNSILVIDNCQIHLGPEVEELCEAQGVLLMYLPKYSPDFNPIELAFSKIKGSIHRDSESARRTLNRTDDDSETAIQGMLFRHIYSVTEKDARGYFEHCGYIDED